MERIVVLTVLEWKVVFSEPDRWTVSPFSVFSRWSGGMARSGRAGTFDFFAMAVTHAAAQQGGQAHLTVSSNRNFQLLIANFFAFAS